MLRRSKNPITTAKEVHAPHGGELASTLTHVDYQLDGALAELIDNSIDANAKDVLIRIQRSGDYPISILVIDDGDGIKKADFKAAMTWAQRRKYDADDTGMFGVGMKSSSLALCEVLTVVSKAKGSSANGCRWTRKNIDKEVLLDLNTAECDSWFRSVTSSVSGNKGISGTLISWESVDEFEVARASRESPARFLEQILVALEQSLGLIFHRFIERGDLNLQIDVQDDDGKVFGYRKVLPINPFKYPKTGKNNYPKILKTPKKELGELKIRAHIWPKGMRTIEFKIPRSSGTGAAESQGIYVYRSDRLLMAGKWAGLESFEAHKSLARLEIDLPSNPPPGIKVNFHKTAVTFQPSIVQAIRAARSPDGTTFETWVNDAIEVHRTQDSKKTYPVDLPRPANALPVDVRRAFDENSTSGPAMKIEWGKVARGKAFRLLDERIIINQDFKSAFKSGDSSGSRGSSLPLALLMLALRDVAGRKRTAKLRALEDSIQNIIYAAMTENS
jgi:hypothetical protein